MQKGWGGLGTGVEQVPDNVLLIGPAPHDWLFPRCSAVVHHGGAGTTAMGLYCGGLGRCGKVCVPGIMV